jgi:hypothetical protein
MTTRTVVLVSAALLGFGSPSAGQAAASTQQATDTTVTLRWRLTARRLSRADAELRRVAREAARTGDSTALRALPPPVMLGRANALLAAAQFSAADSAQLDRAQPSRRVALAAASATILTLVYPHSADQLRRELERDVADERAAGVPAARTEAAVVLGRTIANAVWSWARSDGSDRPWQGTVPTGPGMWRNAQGAEPGGAAFPLRRPWLLDSVAQFRLPPPPAFDSPEFKRALDEVRRVARERTPEQARIARLWVEGGPPAWVDTTTDLLLRYRVADDVVLRMMTILAIGGYDLMSACWDTKYHYWVLRPTHADSTITLAEGISLPNFPAYPSGHACFAGFASTIIGHYLPAARDEVRRLAEENALSRLWAGVHYRFDNDAGLEMGRTVARYLMEMEGKGALRRRWR